MKGSARHPAACAATGGMLLRAAWASIALLAARDAATASQAPEAPETTAQVRVEIVRPADGATFAFDAGEPGRLSIELEASVDPPSYAGQVRWRIDAIPGSQISPRAPKGASTAAVFTGLPADNAAFGRKKILATVGGGEDEVEITVFFSPTAANHPGEGSGRTPNWFYYWSQTKAGRGYAAIYEPERKGGGAVSAQYDYRLDTLVVTDLAWLKPCRSRHPALTGGRRTLGSEGIDCFAELLRHETQHKKERWEWWGETNPLELRDSNDTAYRTLDADYDLVPNKVEKRLEKSKGCLSWKAASCDGRPDERLLDVEMNAYWVGWQWPVGAARKEDWAACDGNCYCGSQVPDGRCF